ncbi:MAG TPA: hypothetical protein VLW65_04300 [Bryobacteraceae bacterium]|nr:hypothetical protein [Bryobacteraceae bacterium]
MVSPFRLLRIAKTSFPIRTAAAVVGALAVLSGFRLWSQALPATAAALPGAVASSGGAAQILDLLGSLAQFDQRGRDPGHKVGFEIPESAVNEYLAYALRSSPRPGIAGMKVTLLPNNEVLAAVEIDFDMVRGWGEEIVPKRLRETLGGRRTIQVNGRVEAGGGVFSFALRDAHGPDGRELSKSVAAGILKAIGLRQPEAYDTARPMPLPFGLKRVWTRRQILCGET